MSGGMSADDAAADCRVNGYVGLGGVGYPGRKKLQETKESETNTSHFLPMTLHK